MHITAIVLLFLAVACEVFSYWGLNTIAGRQAFDKKAGIIPFAAGLFGGVLAACAVLVWWFGRRARTRRNAG
jgi:drug/metabolite transporter (DMT)-like permease